MIEFVKGHNGGRVHALAERWNRLGRLTLCGRNAAAEPGTYTRVDVTCKTCERSLTALPKPVDHRQAWTEISERVSETDEDGRLDWGRTIAMENASATVGSEGLTNQDDLWFETAVRTWHDWEDAPWGLEGTQWEAD